jgi:hypothetical protein
MVAGSANIEMLLSRDRAKLMLAVTVWREASAVSDLDHSVLENLKVRQLPSD